MTTLRPVQIAVLLVAAACADPAGPTTRALPRAVLASGVGSVTAILPGWTSTANMLAARLSPEAVTLLNGRVLVVGGADDSGILSSAEVYDPATNVWTSTGSMATPRIAFAAVRLGNGKVFVVGGCNCPGAELYDPGAGTWSAVAPASVSRGGSGNTAVLLNDGRILVVEGPPELYDPATNQWSLTGPTGVRNGPSITPLADGRVLVAGGAGATAAVFNPTTNQWSAAASMAVSRVAHTGVRLPDGRVLVAGGLDAGNGILDSAELYDPTTDSWAAAPPMGVKRYGHRAALLPNGHVLQIGGTSPTFQLSTFSVDAYDPQAASWAVSADMHWRRTGHAAVVLPGGKVLVAGGHNGTLIGAIRLPTAEVFSEATTVPVVLGGRRPAVDGFLAYAGTFVTGTSFTVPNCIAVPQNDTDTRIAVAFLTAVGGETVFPATAHITLAGGEVTPVLPAQGFAMARLLLPSTSSILLGTVSGIVPGTIDRTTDDTDRLTISCDQAASSF